jgi:hypothetical protein
MSEPRVVQGKRGTHLPIQIRIRQDHEPELFEFILGLKTGTVSAFLRSILDQAYRSGSISPSGFSLTRDMQTQTLQAQLKVALEDNIILNQKLQRVSLKINQDQDQERTDFSPARPDLSNDQPAKKTLPSKFASSLMSLQDPPQ